MTKEIHDIIVAQMAAIRDDVREVRRDLALTREEISALRAKAKIWGAVAGGALGAIASLIAALAK